MAFDASRANVAVEGRLLNPGGNTGANHDLTKGNQQKAIYFGPNQDNYAKAEIENNPLQAGTSRISLVTEQAGKSTLDYVLTPVPLTSITTLDLRLTADLNAGTFVA